jgi:gliding motility-associated-like protein
MNHYKSLARLLFLLVFLVIPFLSKAQISAVADATVQTEYSSGAQDNIYVFCGTRGEQNGELTASEPSGEVASFEWSKYNVQTGNFEVVRNENSGTTTSTIDGLADGGYRVKISSASGENTYTAWVFNNYIEALAEIPESDCNSFLLNGSFEAANFTYSDLSNGQPKELFKDTKIEWMQGDRKLSTIIEYRNYSPPTSDTDYKLVVSDRFGCVGESTVSYKSIVTKASFEFQIPERKSDSEKDEAPLTVTFTNTSENGDLGKYEWFIYKDLQKIKEEKDAGTFKDSIMDVVYNDNPVYTFQETGEYIVKLVSKHVSEIGTCTDTFYIANHILIAESFIDAPNVFTPNGDGTNDFFAVKFFSMKSVKITIVNRWGKVVHKWENNNVKGFYNTASDEGENYDAASVWDGKIGGKYASPGVYYYVAEGIGRDGKRRKANGFFHLFRDK